MLPILFMALAGQSAPFSKLIDKCDATVIRNGACGDLDKPVWKRFEDTTGEVTKVNMRSIQPMQNGGVIVTTYTFAPRAMLDLRRLRRLLFTCRGQYADMASMNVVIDAPPRSVAGLIAATVCPIGDQKRSVIRANNARVEAEEHARAVNPRPSDYCQGFDAGACTRIQAGVNAKAKPAYCKDGFGIVGSGLNDEQLRICYARAPKDDEGK